MPINLDDLSRISGEAARLVDDTYHQTARAFYQPEHERQTVAEYEGMTPEEHGEMLERLGLKEYQKYIDTMEKIKAKHKRR